MCSIGGCGAQCLGGARGGGGGGGGGGRAGGGGRGEGAAGWEGWLSQGGGFGFIVKFFFGGNPLSIKTKWKTTQQAKSSYIWVGKTLS